MLLIRKFFKPNVLRLSQFSHNSNRTIFCDRFSLEFPSNSSSVPMFVQGHFRKEKSTLCLMTNLSK